MRIYIMRHGETDANAAGVFQGQYDGKLLENGYVLAREVGKALSDIRFDAVFSSRLTRARETARTVLEASGNGNLHIQMDERLLEIDMGDYEGKRFRPGEREVDAEMCRLFFEDPFAFPGFPNGEDAHQLCERTQAFLVELSRREDLGTVLVSTHGFAIRAMLNHLYPNPTDFWQGHVPYNCSVSIVEAENGKCKLLAMDKIYYDKALCVDRYAKY